MTYASTGKNIPFIHAQIGKMTSITHPIKTHCTCHAYIHNMHTLYRKLRKSQRFNQKEQEHFYLGNKFMITRVYFDMTC